MVIRTWWTGAFVVFLAACGDGSGGSVPVEDDPIIIVTSDAGMDGDAGHFAPHDTGEVPTDVRTEDDVETFTPDATMEDADPDASDLDEFDRWTRVIPDDGAVTNGWKWMNPLPQGNDLTGVWGTAADDVVAVGDAGTILHWDGSALTLQESPTTVNLWDVWGVDSQRWAVGDDGTFLRGDESAWSSEEIGTNRSLRAVWGSAPDDIWVAVVNDDFRHWDGAAWSRVSVPGHIVSMNAIRGRSSDDVWAVGAVGKAAHWDGQEWTAYSTPDRDFWSLNDLWSAGPDAVWAVGGGLPPAVRWDGSAWNEWNPAGTPPRPNVVDASDGKTIWGSSEDDLWLSSRDDSMDHWDGTKWSRHPTGVWPAVEDIWGSGPDNVFAVGQAGVIQRWDGSDWGLLTGGETGGFGGLTSSGDELWAVGASGGMLHWDGTELVYRRHGFVDLTDAWAISEDDVWAVGREGTLLHWDGVRWEDSEPPPGDHQFSWLRSVWGSASDDVWVSGWKGLLWHWDGSSWTEAPIATTVDLNHIWGFANDDIWILGADTSTFPAQGALFHFDGSSWTRVDVGTDEVLHGLWGAAPDDLWAVADRLILHFDGTDWETVVSGPDTPKLGRLWGRSSDDIWSMGTDGKVWHWDGTEFSVTPSPSVDWYGGDIVGTATGLWIAGPNGALLRRE